MWKRWSPRSGQRLIVLILDLSSFRHFRLVLVIGHVFHFTSKMFFAMGDDSSYGLNTLGSLCLWQCFICCRCYVKAAKVYLITLFLINDDKIPRFP